MTRVSDGAGDTFIVYAPSKGQPKDEAKKASKQNWP